MLKARLSSSEVTSLLVEIALMPSVHSSTVDFLISQYESLNSEDYIANQLILSLGTLGHHTNVEDKIVRYLSMKLTTADTPEEISVFIHALGNTASKKIIPILDPFISDATYQAYAIDALRGVSMDDAVEKEFTTVVSESLHPQVVLEVVESLMFPFKTSIYSYKIKKERIVREELKSALIKAGIKYNEDELTDSLKQYFTAINDGNSVKMLKQGLKSSDVNTSSRGKRGSSFWASHSDSNYNLIESLAQRRSDMKTYSLNRGYLWAKKIGSPKVYANVVAGGFGGMGYAGIKLYARAKLSLYAWSSSYTGLDVLFSYTQTFPDNESDSTLTYRHYIKIVGYTLLNDYYSTTDNYKYTRSWHKSVRVFSTGYSFWIYVGILRLTLSGYISGTMKFHANIARLEDEYDTTGASLAQLTTGPRFTVTGQAEANILVRETKAEKQERKRRFLHAVINHILIIFISFDAGGIQDRIECLSFYWLSRNSRGINHSL